MKTPRSKRRRWISWALLGLLAYGVSLVALLPAAVVWDQLRDRIPKGLAAQGIAGTLWSGSASSLALPEGLVATGVTWELRPGALLAGRLAWSLAAGLPGGQVNGQLAVSMSGLWVTGARGDFDAAPVVTPFLGLPVIIEGRVAMDIQQLVVTRNGQVREASGVVGWLGAGAGLPQAVPLGDLRGELGVSEAGGLRLVIRDQGGPLLAEGTVEVAAGGRYRIEGVAGSRQGADPRLVQALRLLGNPGPDGRTPIRFSGGL